MVYAINKFIQPIFNIHSFFNIRILITNNTNYFNGNYSFFIVYTSQYIAFLEFWAKIELQFSCCVVYIRAFFQVPHNTFLIGNLIATASAIFVFHFLANFVSLIKFKYNLTSLA